MGQLLGIDMPLALAEFLYSAILWGSLISWLLWKALRRWRNVWSYLLLGGPFLWLSLHTLVGWYGFFFPPMGRVLDDSPDRPMAGERVIATWVTYPLGLWTNYCSGRQVHLTDSDGEFAFRFAPWPTLVWGSLQRGVNSRVAGRIGESTLQMIWQWPHGDRIVRRFSASDPNRYVGPNTSCRVYLYPMHTVAEYPTAAGALEFNRLYRELCIERAPWAANSSLLVDMVFAHRTSDPALLDISPDLYKSFEQYAESRSSVPLTENDTNRFCQHFAPAVHRSQPGELLIQ